VGAGAAASVELRPVAGEILISCRLPGSADLIHDFCM
jgi:hypothetical protein